MIEELSARVLKLENTFGAFQKSEKFRSLLEVLLALGNYLNGTSNRGGAYGFSISSFQKVIEMKSQDNKTSLLEYVVAYCAQRLPSVLQLNTDFPDLEDACKGAFYTVPISQYKVELSDIEKAYRVVSQAMSSQSLNPLDQIEAKLSQFSTEFRPEIDAVKARVDSLEGKYAGLCEFLGTEMKEMPLEELLEKLHTFIAAFETSRVKLEKTQAEQERQSRIDARKKAAEASKVTDTVGLAQEIRMKRQLKGATSAQNQTPVLAKKTTAELHDAVRTRRGTRIGREGEIQPPK
jgi:cytokinesis protein